MTPEQEVEIYGLLDPVTGEQQDRFAILWSQRRAA